MGKAGENIYDRKPGLRKEPGAERVKAERTLTVGHLVLISMKASGGPAGTECYKFCSHRQSRSEPADPHGGPMQPAPESQGQLFISSHRIGVCSFAGQLSMC